MKATKKHYSVKARLAMIGKRQIDLYDEINKLGGAYHLGSPSYFSNIINDRQTGGKAQMVMTKCLQILNRWEMEANNNA
jgi:hypothetical protein